MEIGSGSLHDPPLDRFANGSAVTITAIARLRGFKMTHLEQVPSARAALGWSSIRSSVRTGTRRSLPILMVGMSPRAAAAYDALRLSPKYFPPASGTEVVRDGSAILAPLVAVPLRHLDAPGCFGTKLYLCRQ